MTGFGDGHAQTESLRCSVELRSVNNRHFKFQLRSPGVVEPLEPEIERLVRESTSRGTINATIRLEQVSGGVSSRLRQDVLAAYWGQLAEAVRSLPGAILPADPGVLLTLPGVIEDGTLDRSRTEEIQPLVFEALRQALTQYSDFRHREGAVMVVDMQVVLQEMQQLLMQVKALAPQVVEEHHLRMRARIQELLQSVQAELRQEDLAREVALFADRCDISEEITRLGSHLQQFHELLIAVTPQGRKLDFLCQEMFREANTIGSKANHLATSRAAVDLKTYIERLREVVQNLE